VLSTTLVSNLYKAEANRLSFVEKLGFDGSTIGRGQLGKSAYSDVLNKSGNEIEEYCKELNIALSGDFNKDMKNSDIEDFVVSAYLA
jgi:hypothetical protein